MEEQSSERKQGDDGAATIKIKENVIALVKRVNADTRP